MMVEYHCSASYYVPFVLDSLGTHGVLDVAVTFFLCEQILGLVC